MEDAEKHNFEKALKNLNELVSLDRPDIVQHLQEIKDAELVL